MTEMSEWKRTERLSCYLSQREKELVSRTIRQLGLTESQFVRNLVFDALSKLEVEADEVNT